VLGLTVCAGLLAFCPAQGAAQIQTAPASKSLTSSIKDGLDKVSGAIVPRKSPAETIPADDAVSLKNKAKPGVAVYVAVARLYEQSGRLAEAEHNYQMALKEKPTELAALLGYARLKEQLGKPEEAIQLYQQAAKAHPNEAAVLNNLGLCYARLGKMDDALAALGRAVTLQPKNPLYRNNIAMVLVEMGRTQEALAQLRSVHGDAAAYYNLGYLLQKKGKKQEAVQQFALALRLDPSLRQAKSWLDRLQGPSAPPAQARVPGERGTAPIISANRPIPPAASAGSRGEAYGDRRPDAKQASPVLRAPDNSGGRGFSPPPAEAPPMPPELSAPRRLPPTEFVDPPATKSAPLP
jgi:tetratricopeptide (TPR) repeat protein